MKKQIANTDNRAATMICKSLHAIEKIRITKRSLAFPYIYKKKNDRKVHFD